MVPLELDVGLEPLSTIDPHTELDQLLDQHLRRLLHDLALFIPYDAAAAWLGTDDRPSLRVVLPADATLPPLAGARHTIFQATAEAARIADFRTTYGVDDSELCCWLGVPLVLHGRRRGWVEVWNTQPNRFSDVDLERAAIIVRHAAFGLTQLEATIQVQRHSLMQQALLPSIQAALYATSTQEALTTLLTTIAGQSRAVAATLILPIELSYALGLKPLDVPLSSAINSFEDESLVSAVAHWSQTTDGAINVADLPELLLPCIRQEDETLGWIALRYQLAQPFSVADPSILRTGTALITAILVWLREQTQREQQAQQSVRMLVQHTHQLRSSAVSDLVAGLAHELNNPISALIGLAQLVQRDASIPAALHSDIEAITTEALRISDFVKRFSHFGQTTGMTKVPLKLNDIVSDTVVVLRGLAQQRQIELACTMPEESPMVLGNRAQLQQLCLDLLSNALDAVETSDAPRVAIEIRCTGQWGLVTVSDNGYGIPEDLRERIFSPGFTTKTTGGTRRGLGIGLPMALDIARSHWGSISVTSQVWQGSCFTLRLPTI